MQNSYYADNKGFAFLFWTTFLIVDKLFSPKICRYQKYVVPLHSISFHLKTRSEAELQNMKL